MRPERSRRLDIACRSLLKWKIRQQIQQARHAHWTNESHEHLVQPGMVYISFPTEYGTLYTKEELTAIYRVCRECHLPLFIDGARLGYGLMSPKNDVTLQDLAAFCDVFYIGGTKCGALFGEAVVITGICSWRDFRYMIKQRGGMLAKGRLLGIQFDTLFTDDLYWKLAKQANRLALRIRKAFLEKGYPLLMDSWTNQQFPVLPDEIADRLSEQFAFEVWERVDETHCAVRFCTSWATTEAQVGGRTRSSDREKKNESIKNRICTEPIDRLITYGQSGAYPFHMPGHKRQFQSLWTHIQWTSQKYTDLTICTTQRGSCWKHSGRRQRLSCF